MKKLKPDRSVDGSTSYAFKMGTLCTCDDGTCTARSAND